MCEPVILAVDTCFGACSAAVLKGACVLASRHEFMQRGHAEALAPMVDDVMRAAGLNFARLDKLAVTTGPGTFTGQRIGLAFMRGLRIALGKPLIGVTSLAAMAEQVRPGFAVAVGVHDAKRGEVYIEAVGRPLPAQVMKVGEAEILVGAFGRVALAGSGAVRLAAACPEAAAFDIQAPDAAWVARLAIHSESQTVPRPLYLRAPDAKLPAAR